MPDLSRRLLAIYLIFLGFLFATAAGNPRAALTVSGGELHRAQSSSQGRNAEILTACRRIVEASGFRLTSGTRLRPWRIAPRDRDGEAGLVYIQDLSSQAAAEAVLAGTANSLIEAAGRFGARVVRVVWGLSWGDPSLRLEVTSAGARRPLPILLIADVPTPRPANIYRRIALIKPEPKPKPAALKPPKPPQLPAPRPEPRPQTVPRPLPARRARVAIILDDVGCTKAADAFLALPANLTFSVLPLCQYSGYFARQAADAGRTVLLHLPLEAESGANPGPGAIRIGMTQKEIDAQLEEDLRSVPGAVGFNNHMGSLATANEEFMWQILWFFKMRGLLFVDSNTPAPPNRSIAEEVAASISVRHARRQIWLDNDTSQAAVERQLRALIAKAKKNGSAIGICHVDRPNTLAALRAMLPIFAREGVEIVPVTELVR